MTTAQSHVLGHNITQVCALTNLGRTSIYEEIKHGRLRARKIGRRTIILDSDLRAWLESRPVVPANDNSKLAA